MSSIRRDDATGTADDRTIVVYSVPTTYPGFGTTIERIVQPTATIAITPLV